MQGPIYYEGEDDIPMMEKEPELEIEEEKFEDVVERGYYDEKTVKNPHLLRESTSIRRVKSKAPSGAAASKQSLNVNDLFKYDGASSHKKYDEGMSLN